MNSAQIMSLGSHNSYFDRISRIKKDIKRLWEQEEKYWGQCSRVKWLKWGDKNSKFFHALNIQRCD